MRPGSSVVAYLRHAGCWGMSSPGALCCARASATTVWMRPARFRAVSRLICRFAAMGKFLRRRIRKQGGVSCFCSSPPCVGVQVGIALFRLCFHVGSNEFVALSVDVDDFD